jgi:hypothetical protein
VTALETEDHLLLAGVTDDGDLIDEAKCRRLFDLPGTDQDSGEIPANIKPVLDVATANQQKNVIERTSAKNGVWFETEMDKLDRWTEDRRTALKTERDELDQQIKEMKKAARFAPNLPEKLEHQRELRSLESKRDEAWRSYDAASREVDRQKDALLDEISRRLKQKAEQEMLFTLRWHLV